MKVNSKVLGIVVLVVIFGGIALSSALGWWQTEGGGGQGNGRGQGAGTVETDGNGQAGVEEDGSGQGNGNGNGQGGEGGTFLRGRTTFQELLDLGLPQETIEQVIGGPLPDPAMRVKIYCDENGLDFEPVKEQLQLEIDRLGGG